MRRTLMTMMCGVLLLAGCDKPAQDADKAAAKAKTDEPAKTEPEVAKAPEPEPEPKPAEPEVPAAPTVSAGDCDETQAAISKVADEQAAPYGILAHLEKNFPDMKISWLMPEPIYDKFVVQTSAKNFGRCNDTACYQFAAPTAVIEAAVEQSLTADGHDSAKLGEALGLPADNMKGPLRMITIDLAATKSCVRLPVGEDPGVWKCKSPDDTDCFKFGGYTSGGVPELMVINAPVDQATIREIK